MCWKEKHLQTGKELDIVLNDLKWVLKLQKNSLYSINSPMWGLK